MENIEDAKWPRVFLSTLLQVLAIPQDVVMITVESNLFDVVAFAVMNAAGLLGESLS